MALPELTGKIERPTEIDIEQMRIEIADLKVELEAAQEEVNSLRESTLRLAQLLGPTYRALQAALGEIDMPGVTQAPSSAATVGNDFWERTKARLGGTMSDIVDILLGHPGMTTTAVATAAHCRMSTASTLLSRMKGQNLVEKKGQLWVLKSLS